MYTDTVVTTIIGPLEKKTNIFFHSKLLSVWQLQNYECL